MIIMWAKNKQQAGFTIVELLIVIVVIGILAAITIVAYNGVQTRARAAAVQNLVTTLSRKASAYNATTGQYPTGDQFKFNQATDSTVTNSGPPEARLDGITLTTLTSGPAVSAANGTTVVRYVNQDVTCGWFDWWDYNNNRITTLSTTPASTKVGC
jgi:prepilin-type N-terminal cleavage/methylation domain-containing protein